MRSESETSKKLALPKEVREFHSLKENLIDHVFKLYNPSNSGNSMNSQLERSDLRLKIVEDLTKIKESLKISMKQTPVSSFLFNNQKELFNTQSALIELANNLLNYVDELDATLQKSAYECLKLIFNRGELDLGCMGFDSKFLKIFEQNDYETVLKHSSIKKNDHSYLKNKLRISMMYQECFYKALKHVLNKYHQIEEKERGFFDNLCVLAYFRVSEFRNKLLACIERKDDEIIEWRGNEWGIDDPINDDMRDSSLISLFSWGKDFNNYLKVNRNFYYFL